MVMGARGGGADIMGHLRGKEFWSLRFTWFLRWCLAASFDLDWFHAWMFLGFSVDGYIYIYIL